MSEVQKVDVTRDLELDMTMIAMHKMYGQDKMIEWCIKESGQFPGGKQQVLGRMQWFLMQPMDYQELAIAKANESIGQANQIYRPN